MDVPGWSVALLAVLALVVADRWMARRPPRERQPRERRPGGGGGGPFGPFDEVFHPQARHLHEEEDRQRHDLVLAGDSDPPWALDLDRGTADLRGSGRDLVEVAPGVHVATAKRWSTTSTVVVGPGGECLLVDPALTPDDVRGLAEEIARRGWRVVAGFATHPHWDHVLWGAALPDVPRWATAEAVAACRGTLEGLRAEVQRESPGHDLDLVGRLTPLPGDAGSAVPWPGREVVVVPLAAHCPGSAALVVPDAHALLAGDLLSDREIPHLDLDRADPVADHLAALDALKDAARGWDVRVLVPGHGTVTDRAGLEQRLAADRAYLQALLEDAVPDDPRLEELEQRGVHVAQRAALRVRRAGAAGTVEP